jgi:hypothetical protein
MFKSWFGGNRIGENIFLICIALCNFFPPNFRFNPLSYEEKLNKLWTSVMLETTPEITSKLNLVVLSCRHQREKSTLEQFFGHDPLYMENLNVGD